MGDGDDLGDERRDLTLVVAALAAVAAVLNVLLVSLGHAAIDHLIDVWNGINDDA